MPLATNKLWLKTYGKLPWWRSLPYTQKHTPVVAIKKRYASDFDESEHPREENGKFAPKGGGDDKLFEVRGSLPDEFKQDASDYHFHATNIENAVEIAKAGLKPHGPSFGTDQSEWPDGSREKRSYFGTANNVWQFAPENGTPVVLRVAKNSSAFKRESTGDFYVSKKISPANIEILTVSGWMPIRDLRISYSYSQASRSLASTQLDLPGDLQAKCRAWVLANVAQEELSPLESQDDSFHITVRYGLHDPDIRGVETALQGLGPVNVELGRVEQFETEKDDVLIVPVVTEMGLLNLRSVLGSLPHTDTHSEYRPHVTLAYVQKGMGKRLLSDASFLGDTAVLDRLRYSDSKKQISWVSLLPKQYAEQLGKVEQKGNHSVLQAKILQLIQDHPDWDKEQIKAALKGEEIVKSTKQFSADDPQFSRFLTPYERKVDFKAIESDITKLSSQGTVRVKQLLTQSKDKLMALVASRHKAGTLTAKFILELELRGLGQLIPTLREVLGAGFRLGQREAKKELKRTFAAYSGDFDEDEHPREEDGRFAPKVEGASEKKENVDPTMFRGISWEPGRGVQRLDRLQDTKKSLAVTKNSHPDWEHLLKTDFEFRDLFNDQLTKEQAQGVADAITSELGMGGGRVVVRISTAKKKILGEYGLGVIDLFGKQGQNPAVLVHEISHYVNEQIRGKLWGGSHTSGLNTVYRVTAEAFLRSRGNKISLNDWYSNKKRFSQKSYQVKLDPTGLPPEKALEFFERKAVLWGTNIRQPLLGEAKGILFDGIKQGSSLREMMARLEQAFLPWLGDEDQMVDDALLTPYRLETLVRTNVTEALNEGRKAQFQDAVDDGFVTGLMFSAVLDARTTEVCKHLDEKVFSPDSPELDRLTPPRHFNCFIDGQTSVYTAKGWKPIKAIEVGDLALTDKGRFQPVTFVHHKQNPQKYAGDVVKIYVQRPRIQLSAKQEYRFITVTPDHPVFVNEKWIAAGDVKRGDRISCLGTQCELCKKVIPWLTSLQSHQAKDKPPRWCSRSCHMKQASRKVWSNPEHHEYMSKKVSEQLQKEYANGTRDRIAITKNANEETRRLYAEGKGILQRPEVRAKMNQAKATSAKWWYAITEGRRGDKNPMRKHPTSAKRASDKLQAFLKANPDRHGNRVMGRAVMAGHEGYISKGHRKLYNCAQQLGLGSVEVEFPIKTLDKNFYADVAFPELKIALEFDGSYWHQDEAKDQERDLALAAVGWKTLRYRDIAPALSDLHADVSRVMANHKGEYVFTSVVVEKVERWKLRKAKRLYNFSVLGDESYIAKGFVVHNCRSLLIPVTRMEGPVQYITQAQIAKGIELSGKGFSEENESKQYEWDEEAHPRVAAGEEGGGRFAPAGGGGDEGNHSGNKDISKRAEADVEKAIDVGDYESRNTKVENDGAKRVEFLSSKIPPLVGINTISSQAHVASLIYASEMGKWTTSSGRENSALIDNQTGKVIGPILLGSEMSVRMGQQFSALKEDSDVTHIHTHPSATSFSAGDISLLNRVPNFRRMLLHSDDGTIYEISRTNKTQIPKSDEVFNVYDEINRSLTPKFLSADVKRIIVEKGAEADTHPILIRAWREQSHEVIKQLAKKYKFRYVRYKEQKYEQCFFGDTFGRQQDTYHSISEGIREREREEIVLYASDFDEEDHPREEDGKFAPKGSGSSNAKSEDAITSQGEGKEKTFFNADGSPVDAATQERINALGIPPGWTGVRVSADPTSSLQAIGYDSSGKEQPKYSTKHTGEANAAKFARCAMLIQTGAYAAMGKGTAADAAKGHEEATVARIILATTMRIGGESDKAIGATTLEARHLSVDGDLVRYDFPGKSGQQWQGTIKDADLAKQITARLEGKSGTDLVFRTNPGKVNAYLKRYGKTSAKDVRTIQGTALAHRELNALGKPTSLKEAKSFVKITVAKVAERLHNKPATAKEHYIDPIVWAPIQAEWGIGAGI